MQRIGASGILKGEGVPYLWANQTWFYPDRRVTEFELIQGLKPYSKSLSAFWGASGDYLTGERLQVLLNLVSEVSLKELADTWTNAGLSGSFTTERQLNRREVSVLLDQMLKPFSREIDWHGSLK
jgi:hypothetical protein